ncbi:dCMP deaminase [Nematocida sp. ERTm5]|nr:dCMP deaminase [Nematocida sp. ERTm5]
MLFCVTSVSAKVSRIVIDHLVRNGFTEKKVFDGIINDIMKDDGWRQDIVIQLRTPDDWLEFKIRPCAVLIIAYPSGNQKVSSEEIAEYNAYYINMLKVRATFLNRTNLIEVDETQIDTIYNHRIRPTWQEYFMSLAEMASLRSNCMKRKVGAVLVRHNRIISVGYNGTSTGTTNCSDGGCERCNTNTHKGKELSDCFCIHAEESAFLERNSLEVVGAQLYTTLYPCRLCARKIIQLKVSKLYYIEEYVHDKEIQSLFARNNIEVCQLNSTVDRTE